jgi:mono/diheme cytochrome c family protein
MGAKTLGVILVTGLALFTALYWLAEAQVRDARFEEIQAQLLERGEEYFAPDNITYEVVVSPSGFDPATLEIEVNSTIEFSNTLGSPVTVRGTGAHPFTSSVNANARASTRFGTDGVTTVTADGASGSLEVTSGPEALNPLAANCAQCHGPEGEGGQVGDTGIQAPNLHSRALYEKLRINPAYVNLVIRYGGVVVSGNVSSRMPAWSNEVNGPLTVEQIDALTALVESWATEAGEQPVEEVPDTVEAGAQVYVDAGCGTCHAADLSGGAGPNLQTIGSEPITEDLPVPLSQLDQLIADYEEDPRRMLELWIRDSAANYNDGTGTGMPAHPEGVLSESALRALITFLLDQT